MSNRLATQKVAIFGSGGFAREVLSFLKDRQDMEVVHFIEPRPVAQDIDRIPVFSEDAFRFGELNEKPNAAIVAIGDPAKRSAVFQKFDKSGVEFISFVHPSAVISASVMIGAGTICYPLVCLHTDVKVGRGVLLNTGVSVGHDSRIDNFVTLNPGVNVAGGVHIKEEAFVGMGASIIENITVGKNALIGAGAVVVKDVPDNVVVMGVPAREVKRRDS